MDVAGGDYFAIAPSNSWMYAKRINGLDGGVVTRRVEGAADSQGFFTVSESDGGTAQFEYLRVGAAGLEARDPFGAQGLWPGLIGLLPSWVEVPTPFYPQGATRRVVRQGDLGADVDGDGKNDYFRIEMTQVFVGFESGMVLGRVREQARFRMTVAFSIASTLMQKAQTAIAVDEQFLVDGLGLVRSQRSGTGPDGLPLFDPYSLELVSATVAGRTSDGNGEALAYSHFHRHVVFDSRRNAYHVSITHADMLQPNRIATIDAATGAIRYSAPVGSGPGPMAISADGNHLFVGLEGSGEVLKLALPSMNEVARVRLPVDPMYGQLMPEDVAASPVDSDLFAVSLSYSGISPRHAGVTLVRGMLLQPRRTAGHTGSNRIEFDGSGGWVIGLNTETSEFGLRRLEVLNDGLVEVQVASNAAPGYGRELNLADGLALVGNRAFAADASLALVGTVANADGCARLPGTSKVACHSTLDMTRLVVADATTFTTADTPRYTTVGAATEWKLVPGRPGQVAISEYGRILIFNSASLR